MELISGSPFRGAVLEKLKVFLEQRGLKYDNRIEHSVCLVENDKIAATGSLDGSVLKCLAVASEFTNEGLAAKIVSELVNEAARKKRFHLFLFTKPENGELFGGLGFYRVAKTDSVLLMENKKNGVKNFAVALKAPENFSVETGAIVANCNPFTKGHLYLVETAAKECGLLYLFIVAENKSVFPAEVRLELVRRGTAHLSNVRVCSTGPYLVSAATFPDYFLKDKPGAVSPLSINTELDIAIFAECFARPLGITRRYVGTEPFDEVTAVYNKQMKAILPRYGIEVIEIPRLENSGGPLSASRVRRLLEKGTLGEIQEIVPPEVYEYLLKNPCGVI
jgi:[citrate (pro-3S)-lyase] ligase